MVNTEAVRLAKGMANIGLSAEQILAAVTAAFEHLEETVIESSITEARGGEQKRLEHDRRWNDALQMGFGIRNAGLTPIEVDRVLTDRFGDLTGDERYNIVAMVLGEKPIPETFKPREEVKPWSIDGLFTELAERKISDKEFIIEGLVPAAQITELCSLPGFGKSILASAFGLAVARGEDFAEHKTKKCPVLYLDRENPGSYWKSDILGELFQRGLGGMGLSLETDDNCPPEWNNLGLLAWVESCTVKPLLIIDSFSQWMIGKNENSVEDVGPQMQQLKALRNMGCTIILIHHANKQGGGRGSTAIDAALDFGWFITRTERVIPCGPKKGHTGLGTLMLANSKGRGSHLSYTFDFDYQRHRFVAATKKAPMVKDLPGMVELIRANPGRSGAYLVGLAGQTNPKVASFHEAKAWITRNIADGFIRPRKAGREVQLTWAEDEEPGLYKDQEGPASPEKPRNAQEEYWAKLRQADAA